MAEWLEATGLSDREAARLASELADDGQGMAPNTVKGMREGLNATVRNYGLIVKLSRRRPAEIEGQRCSVGAPWEVGSAA